MEIKMKMFYDYSMPLFCQNLGITPDGATALRDMVRKIMEKRDITKCYEDLIPEIVEQCQTLEEVIYSIYGFAKWVHRITQP